VTTSVGVILFTSPLLKDLLRILDRLARFSCDSARFAVLRAGRHHWFGKVGIPDQGVFPGVEQLIMPPFIAIKIPTRGCHDTHKEMPVALGIATDIRIAVMGQRRKRIERGAHIQVVSSLVDQCQVDGNAARMRRCAPGVGKEFRVRGMRPQRPLRFGRPQCVEYPESQSQDGGEPDGFGQRGGCVRVQVGAGARVYRCARKVA
jgi:hypothetical protein